MNLHNILVINELYVRFLKWQMFTSDLGIKRIDRVCIYLPMIPDPRVLLFLSLLELEPFTPLFLQVSQLVL